MKQNILIASATRPTNAKKFFDAVTTAAPVECKVLVTRGTIVAGPGCNNYAFEVIGSETDINYFGKSICMALMPAKWCFTADYIKPGFNCEIELAQAQE